MFLKCHDSFFLYGTVLLYAAIGSIDIYSISHVARMKLKEFAHFSLSRKYSIWISYTVCLNDFVSSKLDKASPNSTYSKCLQLVCETAASQQLIITLLEWSWKF
jgi:hypothetical protein